MSTTTAPLSTLNAIARFEETIRPKTDRKMPFKIDLMRLVQDRDPVTGRPTFYAARIREASYVPQADSRYPKKFQEFDSSNPVALVEEVAEKGWNSELLSKASDSQVWSVLAAFANETNMDARTEARRFSQVWNSILVQRRSGPRLDILGGQA